MLIRQTAPISNRTFVGFILALVLPIAAAWAIPGIEDKYRWVATIAGPIASVLIFYHAHKDFPPLPPFITQFFAVMVMGFTLPFFLEGKWQAVPVIGMFVVVPLLVWRFLRGQIGREDKAVQQWDTAEATVRTATVTSQSTGSGFGRTINTEWLVELLLDYTYGGAQLQSSTAAVAFPTPTFATRAEAEKFRTALVDAHTLTVRINPANPIEAWPAAWLEGAPTKTAVGGFGRILWRFLLPAVARFVLAVVPAFIVSGAVSSLMPVEAREAHSASNVLIILLMLVGFAFVIVSAMHDLSCLDGPKRPNRGGRWLGAALLLLVVAQVGLAASSIRSLGYYNREQAERYGVTGLLSWLLRS